MTTPDDERDDELEALLDAKEAREKAAREAVGAKAAPSPKPAAAKEATPAPAAAASKLAASKPSDADAPKSKTVGDVPKSKALAKPAAVDAFGRITLVVAIVLSIAAAVAAPLQLALIAETKVKGALVAFFAALSLLLSLRALLVRRKAPLAVGPALIAVVAASLALTAAGFLAFQERSAAAEVPEGGRPRAADRAAWELGRGQQRSRDLALSGGLAIPGFALGALALGLGIGARRRAGAEIEKDAADPKAAKGKRRKMVVAGWSGLLVGAAIFAAGLAVDALAILAPVDMSPHPRVADLAKIRAVEKAPTKEACDLLEEVLADETPIDLVRSELPAVEEVAHQCTTDAIKRLPKGMSCVQRAATLGSSETTKLVHAEDRVTAACERALTE